MAGQVWLGCDCQPYKDGSVHLKKVTSQRNITNVIERNSSLTSGDKRFQTK